MHFGAWELPHCWAHQFCTMCPVHRTPRACIPDEVSYNNEPFILPFSTFTTSSTQLNWAQLNSGKLGATWSNSLLSLSSIIWDGLLLMDSTERSGSSERVFKATSLGAVWQCNRAVIKRVTLAASLKNLHLICIVVCSRPKRCLSRNNGQQTSSQGAEGQDTRTTTLISSLFSAGPDSNK